MICQIKEVVNVKATVNKRKQFTKKIQIVVFIINILDN